MLEALEKCEFRTHLHDESQLYPQTVEELIKNEYLTNIISPF